MKNSFFNVSFFFVLLFFAILRSLGQQKENSVISWEDKLYEKSVDYGSFACNGMDKKVINDFFKAGPLNRRLQVCHNNCAILRSFPERPLPSFDAKIEGTGFIAIHVLANEKGEPIFARALNGHSVMRSLLQKRTCEAIFATSGTKRHKIMFLCVTGNCETAQPVQ
jgi:hypothetical protein